MDVALFFGRFHPLVVHLPIGFIVLACILFGLSFFKQFSFLLKTIPVVLLLGALSAVAAVIVGLLLATEGGYDETTLGWHQWIGILVTVISMLCWLWMKGFSWNNLQQWKQRIDHEETQQRIVINRKRVGMVMVLLFLLISITGHLGGSLTHGDQYLVVHAPAFVQTLLINQEEKLNTNFPADSDSIQLFDFLINPILQQKCASCHNENKIKGGLLLTTREGLLKGGENGVVIESGSSVNSELVKRICLDPTNRKFMPPKGAAMSFSEISLLRFWIDNGMSFDIAITDESLTPEIKAIIEERYSVSTAKKSFIEKEKVAKVQETILDSVRAHGYQVNQLSDASNFLAVAAKDSLTKEKVDVLMLIQDQITWLDLGNSKFKDDWMVTLSNFKNLTKLSLDNNALSDSSMHNLLPLAHLEVLNVHNTNITNASLNELFKIESLKRLYAWQTKVTQSAVDSLTSQNTALQIDIGIKE